MRALFALALACLAVPAAAQQKASLLRLVPFATAPFPYDGKLPDGDAPFLDVNQDGRRGHTAPRGGVHWQDETYSDNRVLLYLPKGFDPARPALIVVYFHGNGAILQRDVVDRQHVPRQVFESGLNAVLVAPQFAVDASDSSAGRFWQKGAFARFLDEAAAALARLYGGGREKFAAMPVVLVAYSGGYDPAAYALAVGGAGARLRGIVLLDALYGETDKFAAWIAARQSAFFFSAFARSARDGNRALEALLTERGIAFRRRLATLSPGSVTFLATGPDLEHRDFVTAGLPLRAVLARIPGYRRRR